MSLRFLSIRGSTRSERQEAVSRVKEAIQLSGGWILDFKFFSNASIFISFEIPLTGVEKLFSLLVAGEIHLDRASEELLAGFDQAREQPSDRSFPAELAGTLQLTFIHNEPDLRIDVPAIPG